MEKLAKEDKLLLVVVVNLSVNNNINLHYEHLLNNESI